MYQISVNLENFRFWDQICPKKCELQKFWENEHEIWNKDIAMYACTKFQFLRLNLPKKDLRVGGVSG